MNEEDMREIAIGEIFAAAERAVDRDNLSGEGYSPEEEERILYLIENANIVVSWNSNV